MNIYVVLQTMPVSNPFSDLKAKDVFRMRASKEYEAFLKSVQEAGKKVGSEMVGGIGVEKARIRLIIKDESPTIETRHFLMDQKIDLSPEGEPKPIQNSNPRKENEDEIIFPGGMYKTGDFVVFDENGIHRRPNALELLMIRKRLKQ